MRWALVALFLVGFGWEGRLSRLRRELTSSDSAKRRSAVHQLARFSASQVGDSLLKALEDSDESVRLAALRVVGEVGLKEATPRLLDWLDDPSADLREGAVKVIGELHDRRATTRLIRALGDSSPEVRRAAIIALAKIDDPAAVLPLVRRLDDDDVGARVEAATALGQLGDERAVGPLVSKARDESADVRAAIVQALGRIGSPRAVSTMLRGLDDDASEARIAAVAALGDVRAESAVEPLKSLLEGNDFRLAQAAVAALGRIGTPVAIDALVESLARDELRTLAEEALINVARQDIAIDRLGRELLERQGNPTVANATRRVLERHATPSIAPLLIRALEIAETPGPVMLALAQTGDSQALIPLLERLRGKDATVAIEALEIFFEIHGPDGRAADPLLAALGRVDLRQRPRVVRLLGAVKAARALPTLRPLLTHDDPLLRRAAVEAIGSIGDPKGADLLMGLLDSDDPRLRFEAAQALISAAAPETLDRLLDRLDSREPFDRHAGLIVLGGAYGRLSDQLDAQRKARIVRSLKMAMMSRDRRMVARAIDAAVVAAQPELAPTIIELATTRFDIVGRHAIFSLGAFDTDDARATLRSLLDHRDAPVASSAASALGEHGGAEDIPTLLHAARAGSWPTRPAASFALSRMARRGLLTPEHAAEVCELARSRDSLVVANALVALSVLRNDCSGQIQPDHWLSRLAAQPAHRAAAFWAAATGKGAQSDAVGCEERGGCEALPDLDSHADLYAYQRDGTTAIEGGLVALAFADGSILVAYTDSNAHIRLSRVPSGMIELLDPTTTPLLAAPPLLRTSK